MSRRETIRTACGVTGGCDRAHGHHHDGGDATPARPGRGSHAQRFFNREVHALYWQDQIDIASTEGQRRRTIRRLRSDGTRPGAAVRPEAQEQSATPTGQDSCTPTRPADLLWHRKLFTPQRTILKTGRSSNPAPPALRARSPLAGMEQPVGHQPRCLLRQSKRSSGRRIPDLLLPR